MLHFTPKQIQEIIDTLEQAHWFFIAKNINPDLVPNSILKNLFKLGFKKKHITKYPELAMQFGILSVYLKDNNVKKITFEELKKIVRSKKFVPLSAAEKEALKLVEMRAVGDIKNLGNRIANVLNNTFVEGGSRQRSVFIESMKDATKKAIKRREGIGFIRRQVADKLNDWSRDLDRISDYVLHEAYDCGRAIAIKKQKGIDTKVFKRVHEDACDSCKSLYLKNKNTFEPKVFTLRELMNNGSNIGRNKKDWKPVIGPLHPWCRCDLEYIPEGFVWSNKTKRFIVSDNKKNKYNFTNLVTIKKT